MSEQDCLQEEGVSHVWRQACCVMEGYMPTAPLRGGPSITDGELMLLLKTEIDLEY